jgi:hypothetical protein
MRQMATQALLASALALAASGRWRASAGIRVTDLLDPEEVGSQSALGPYYAARMSEFIRESQPTVPSRFGRYRAELHKPN